jgi:hypothetical protein
MNVKSWLENTLNPLRKSSRDNAFFIFLFFQKQFTLTFYRGNFFFFFFTLNFIDYNFCIIFFFFCWAEKFSAYVPAHNAPRPSRGILKTA